MHARHQERRSCFPLAADTPPTTRYPLPKSLLGLLNSWSEPSDPSPPHGPTCHDHSETLLLMASILISKPILGTFRTRTCCSRTTMSSVTTSRHARRCFFLVPLRELCQTLDFSMRSRRSHSTSFSCSFTTHGKSPLPKLFRTRRTAPLAPSPTLSGPTG
jgi:hypothetical protein